MAILAVVVHHLPDAFGGVFGVVQYWGGRGVDLFFVLSGYLIGTTCLNRAARPDNPGRVAQAKAYWLLRTARIFPLYMGILAALAIGFGFIPREVTTIFRDHPWPYLTFTSNYVAQPTLELGILWSLAIEEQFYLVVGILVLTWSQRRETLTTALSVLGMIVIPISLLSRYDLVVLYRNGGMSAGGFIYFLHFITPNRMDQLGLGVLCAVLAPVLNRLPLFRSPRGARLTTWLAIAACVAVLLALPRLDVSGFFLLGLAFALGLLWTQRPAARSLSAGKLETVFRAPLAWVGKLSFGLYLIHAVVRSWIIKLFPLDSRILSDHLHHRLHAGTFLLLWMGVTLALAVLSHRFLEEPINSWARRRAKALVAPLASANALTLTPEADGSQAP